MTAPAAKPTAPPAEAEAPKAEAPKPLEIGGKPAILVEKNADGSGGTLMVALKADPKCTTCAGTGYVRHGALVPCKCTPEGKDKQYDSVYSR